MSACTRQHADAIHVVVFTEFVEALKSQVEALIIAIMAPVLRNDFGQSPSVEKGGLGRGRRGESDIEGAARGGPWWQGMARRGETVGCEW